MADNPQTSTTPAPNQEADTSPAPAPDQEAGPNPVRAADRAGAESPTPAANPSHDALVRLLDATRLGTLAANRDAGQLFATVSAPDAKGSAYTSRLVEITADGVVPLSRGAASIGAIAPDDSGGVFFTAKRAGDDGEEPDDSALFWLPPRGEARQLAQHTGGFGSIAARPGVVVAQVPLHSQAATEAQHARLSKQREDAGVTAALHAGFPLRYWNADLGPAREVVAVARLPHDLTTAEAVPAPSETVPAVAVPAEAVPAPAAGSAPAARASARATAAPVESAAPAGTASGAIPAPVADPASNADAASTPTPAPTRDPAADGPRSILHLEYPRMPEGRMLNWTASHAGDFAIVTVENVVGSPITGGTELQVTSLHRVDLIRDAAPQLLFTAPTGHGVGAVELSPDDTKLLYDDELEWSATTSLTPEVRVLELETGTSTRLWPDHDFWVAPVWLDNGTIVATSDDAGRGSVWIGAVDAAAPRRLAGGPEQRFAFANPEVCPALAGSAPDAGPGAEPGNGAGRRLHVVATASAVDSSPFPVAIDPDDGTLTPLPNPATQLHTPGDLREVHARAADGTDLRAWLLTPAGGGPHPLLVFAHGGPWGSWNAWTFRWNPGPFVAAGYAVLLPDPAISTGYGQAMIDRGQQELGGAPFTDILTLTDAATALPAIDETRTALAGGSYGGYMANWMAGHTGDRFRCIVTHASLWNTRVMGKTTDNSGWDESMAGQHERFSPHRFAGRIEVPMLVIHGDKDYRVPIGQGEELWMDLLTKSRTPLDAHGRTQHRFLYFPDEGHWILGRGNAQVWYETVLGFVDTHVRGSRWERPATLG